MGRLLLGGLIIALAGSANAQNAIEQADSQTAEAAEKPVITRVDDAGLGWLKGSKREDLRLDPSSSWNVDAVASYYVVKVSYIS